MIKVTVWNEFVHERTEERITKVYPYGIHKEIAAFLGCDDDLEVTTATLDDANCGITKESLAQTDVLIWWGHIAHEQVPDEIAYMVRDAVLDGMGLICLHSAHHSKPFRYLLGTSCNLTWRESDDQEILWVIEPSHPITAGIDRYFIVPHEETYGEPFVIPTPDKLLLIGNYSGGEVFRSSCLYERGNGKIFYFQPGHEAYPTFRVPEVQQIIRNAVRFVAPRYRKKTDCPHVRKITCEEPYVI